MLVQNPKNGEVHLKQSQSSLASSIPLLELHDCMLDMQAAVCLMLDRSVNSWCILERPQRGQRSNL